MTQDQISVLLGRPLSSIESTDFNTYYNLALNRVSDLICSTVCPSYEETMVFEIVNGYRTLNLPIFTDIVSITVGSNVLDETSYKVKQNSSLNGDWFNAVVFNYGVLNDCETISVEADWGFNRIPLDVQQMIAEQFGIASSILSNDNITRKQVEDFSIYLKGSLSDAFDAKYASTIAKYSSCNKGQIQSGDVRRGEYGRFYGIQDYTLYI